eukprot:EG_transcript_3799
MLPAAPQGPPPHPPPPTFLLTPCSPPAAPPSHKRPRMEEEEAAEEAAYLDRRPPRPALPRQPSEEDFPLSQGDNPSPPRRRARAAALPREDSSPCPSVEDAVRGLSRRGKYLHDRIHDHIALPPLLVAVIDTPEFQRLRKLNQLGCTQFLFPSAMHTRFEHCIGVAHIAGKMVNHLRQSQPELEIDDRDVLCVMFAGLVHDLGHGPFSHTFERFVNHMREKAAHQTGEASKRWHHEENSVLMLRALIESNNIGLGEYGLHPEYDLRFVEALIGGLKDNDGWPQDIDRPPDKRFLFDIVANKRSGVDVDKLDYFLRDATNCYGQAGIDCQVQRLISCCRVVPVHGIPQICFEEKVALSLGDIFLLRAKLHKYVYQHHTVKVVEEMLLDVFEAAEGHFWLTGTGGRRLTLSQSVDDPVAYRVVGDWILDHIEASNSPGLEAARQIVGRLRRRQLYPMVGHICLGEHHRMGAAEIEADIHRLSPRAGLAGPRDVVASIAKITYGSSDSSGVADDPIRHVNFFNPKVDPDRARALPLHRVSSLFRPTAFEERTLFVFARRAEAAPSLRLGFEAWKKLEKRNLVDDAVPFNFSPQYRQPTPPGRVGSPLTLPVPAPSAIAPSSSCRRLFGQGTKDEAP